MTEQDLPAGWYRAEDGTRRYWTGSTWVTPDAGDATPPPDEPAHPATSRKPILVVLAVAVGLLLLFGGVAGVMKASADAQAAQHAATIKRTKERAAQRAAQLESQRAEKAAADAAERESRASLISSLEKSVQKTAKKDVALGILTGPILEVTCTPLGGGSTDDLTQRSATFECFATNKKNDDGTANGYTFSATANWTTGEYTWKLGS